MKPLVFAVVAAGVALAFACWPGAPRPAASASIAVPLARSPSLPQVDPAGEGQPAERAPAAEPTDGPSPAPEHAGDEVLLSALPLEVISKTSSLVLLEVTPVGVERLEVIDKPLAFRELNRGSGPYAYRLLDARGEPLFSGEFELPELCPLAGHEAPHVRGHVVIEHQTVLSLRVPALAEASQLEVVRHIPLADARPHPLGTIDLRSPHETASPARLPALAGE